jgi:hypothetical protein
MIPIIIAVVFSLKNKVKEWWGGSEGSHRKQISLLRGSGKVWGVAIPGHPAGMDLGLGLHLVFCPGAHYPLPLTIRME